MACRENQVNNIFCGSYGSALLVELNRCSLLDYCRVMLGFLYRVDFRYKCSASFECRAVAKDWEKATGV